MKCIPLALALGLCAAGLAFAQTAAPLPLVGVLRTAATNKPFAEARGSSSWYLSAEAHASDAAGAGLAMPRARAYNSRPVALVC